MRVMVTGAQGQLGFDCVKWLEAHHIPCCGVDLDDFDLTDGNAVMQAIAAWKPDAIIHCGAYTQINRAETQPEVCIAVNGMGTLNVVRAALHVGAKLLYVSADYVFSGQGDLPYGTNHHPAPMTIYGLSKAQGEEAIRSLMQRYFIVRTGWLYSRRGSNIVRSMLRNASVRSEIVVEDDQYLSPTFTADLADLICTMIATERYGVYHATNDGWCSAADFASELLRLSGSRARIRTTSTHKRPYHAASLLNGRLDCSSLAASSFKPLPAWQDALSRFLKETDDSWF